MTSPNLIEVSMVITKASLQPDGSMRWQAVVSDTSPDSTGEATSIALFQDWIRRSTTDQRVEWLPPPRMPFLGISHYSDLDGFGEAGITEKMYIDGDKFKASGVFYDTPLGRALFNVVRTESEMIKRGQAVPKPIRISAAWWDIGHSHGPFTFERKSLTDTCPMCAKGESANKIYLMGQPDHFASTRVPIHPRTSLLTERSMTTRKEDAVTIIGEELADELEAKSRLVGKSEAGLVIKADKKPMTEEDEEETEEAEEGKGKKKPKGGSFLTDKAYTWEEAKALPQARNLSRFGLMGLVRRSVGELPESERLGALEALLDAVDLEVQEIKTAVEDMYFLQPAVDDGLEAIEREDIVMADYLSEFVEAVQEARDSDQPTEQKAALMQAALSKLVPAMKADLEPQAEPGDMVAAFKAAIAPLSDQLAQLNARLGASQQPVVVMPTQKSLTAAAMAQQQPQSQLPVSPFTGQPSSITALVRRNTGL